MNKSDFAEFAKWVFMAALTMAPSLAMTKGETMIRKSALAGSWYPADPRKLSSRLDLYLERCGSPKFDSRPVALISPHAGYLYSGQAAAYGYKALENTSIDKVIILGISHYYPLTGAALPEANRFETPLGTVEVNQEDVKTLISSPLFQLNSKVHEKEHSIEIQIPFLQKVLKKEFSIVPIAVGQASLPELKKIATEIKKISGPHTLIIASSDFTHYGNRFDYVPSNTNIPATIETIDQPALKEILNKDADAFISHCEKTGATICGRHPIAVLLAALPPIAIGNMLRYYRSGDITGEWDNSVSYASVLFTAPERSLGKKGPAQEILFEDSEQERRQKEMLTLVEQKELLHIARQTIESFVRDNNIPDFRKAGNKTSAGLKKNLGVFVTLKENGRLRGCIGNISAQEPLFQGVIENAVNSCARDTRFPPVTPSELSDIHIEISVLSPMKKAESFQKILPGWHGVLLQKGRRQAVYLPQVPLEIGWELEEMLSHLSRKAGLQENDWREGAEFFTFEAQIFSEEK